jgi:hypothetical protein
MKARDFFGTSDPAELRVLRWLYRQWRSSGSLLTFDEWILL